MDHRLFRAACNGDIEKLHELIQENPFLLGDDSLINLNENPIIIAIKSRQLLFVIEIKKLRPQLVAQPSQDGFLPLHIACSYGYVEIVKELLSTPCCDTITYRGKDGKVALHYAATNGRVDIIDELLNACSDSLKEVTYFGETALHLAVKYFKFEALKHLLLWLEHVGMTHEVVNMADKEGNTVLHYAVSRKQLQTVEYLLQWNNNIESGLVNAVNKKGFTAMDLLDILTEFSSDFELRKILQIAGGVSSEIHSVPNNNNNEVPRNNDNVVITPVVDACKCNNLPDKKPDNWLEYFQFQYKRDSPGEARDALLVVAALFATVTFQAGINPPQYIFENNQNSQNHLLFSLTGFLCANTLALSAAMMIIGYLTSNMPFQRELRLASWFMMFGYGWSIGYTRPTGNIKIIMLNICLFLPWLIRVLPRILKRRRGD